jgi:hypothetical protein
VKPVEQRKRVLCGVVTLWGFLLTCAWAYRDAQSGYEIRVWNRTAFPIEVYLVNDATVHLFDVWHGEMSRPYLLKRTEVGELVFAPRGTGRRIARIELPGDALPIAGSPDGPLFVELNPTNFLLTDGHEWGITSPLRVGPEAPLLYIGAIGWCLTIGHWRKRR